MWYRDVENRPTIRRGQLGARRYYIMYEFIFHYTLIFPLDALFIFPFMFIFLF